MMDLDHAKTVVNHLLTATDIKAVCYVDDKFQKDAEIDDHIEEISESQLKNVMQMDKSTIFPNMFDSLAMIILMLKCELGGQG